MRHFVQQVFNDFVVGTSAVYTAPVYQDILAVPDRFAIQAVVDQVTGTTPTLTVQVEQSSDGLNWASKSGTAEINGVSLSSTATNNLTGTEPGTDPSASRVRLRIALGGTSPQAHVRVYVTGRDRVP